MPKKDLLGTNKLDWLRLPGKSDSVGSAELSKPADKSERIVLPDSIGSADESEKFTLIVPPDLAERLYSEAFHDPERRWMKDVITEILREGLLKRENKGPAPAKWISDLKSRGKKRKS